jgi:hypothetical protein
VTKPNATQILLRTSALALAFGAPACGSSESDGNSPLTAAGGSSGFPVITGGSAGAAITAGGSAGAPTIPVVGGAGGLAVGAGGGPGAGGGLGGGGGPGAGGSASAGGASGAGGATTEPLPNFSFFVTSLRALQELSKSQNGFGGDLSWGEEGEGAGLRGADKICAAIAERSLPGASAKPWRAFLSATAGGPGGGPVHAIDRIGEGPWYDRLGRQVAGTKSDLQRKRPAGDATISDDLPNEDGIPNHAPDPTQPPVDNHQTLTGSNGQGQLFRADPRYTCQDWTSAVPSSGTPHVGQSWLRMGFPVSGGAEGYGSWLSSGEEAGCGAGVNLIEMGPPDPENPVVGSGGGYGGFYCFALVP